ncbi:MAG: 50S ribosomal protein L20 [Patescibacteria group bacterium]
MTRVKRGTIARKRRKNILENTKGYQWGRKSKFRAAKEALLHAWTNMFRDRKKKKRVFRSLWQIKINAASRKLGLSYNKLIHGMKEKNIELDRKVLAEIVESQPQAFEKIVEKVKG